MPPAASLQEAPLASQKEVENEDTKIPPLKAVSALEERPFPWNVFSDRTYFMAGGIILLFIIIPSMTIILLSNILGFVLLWTLYDYNPVTRTHAHFSPNRTTNILPKSGTLHSTRSSRCFLLAMDDLGNNHSTTGFLLGLSTIQSLGLEVSTFFIYHLFRVGPRHQMFAHHATLVHKEGHAHKDSIEIFFVEKRVFLIRNGFDDVSWIMSMLALQVSCTAPFPITMRRLTIRFIIVGTMIQEMFIPTWTWIALSLILTFSTCHAF